MKLSDCQFCGNFEKRIVNEGDGNILFIVSGDKSLSDVEKLALVYSEAMFVWRYACVDAPDVSLAMSGCFVMLRFLIARAALVFVPVEYAKPFFGSAVAGCGEFNVGGKTVVVYDKLSPKMYEVYTSKTAPISS